MLRRKGWPATLSTFCPPYRAFRPTQALQLRLDELLRSGRRVVLVGDLNIAPAHVDVCGATPADFNTQREDRAWLRRLMTRGSLQGAAAAVAAGGSAAGEAVVGVAGCPQQQTGSACVLPGEQEGAASAAEAAGIRPVALGGGGNAGVVCEESRHGLEQPLGGNAGWNGGAELEDEELDGEEGLEQEAWGCGWLQREVQGRGRWDGEGQGHEEEEGDVRVPFHDTFRAFHPNR